MLNPARSDLRQSSAREGLVPLAAVRARVSGARASQSTPVVGGMQVEALLCDRGRRSYPGQAMGPA